MSHINRYFIVYFAESYKTVATGNGYTTSTRGDNKSNIRTVGANALSMSKIARPLFGQLSKDNVSYADSFQGFFKCNILIGCIM